MTGTIEMTAHRPQTGDDAETADRLQVGALAVVGAIAWPVAAVLGAGRLPAHAHRWRSLAAFGDALEHA